MKKKFISLLAIFSVLFLWGESNYLTECAEYRDLDGGIKGGIETKAGFDSLNVSFVGNWPFGYSYAVTNDTIRDICFLGSGGGVYILDVSDSSNPVKVSEGIHTRGYVYGLYYDYTTERLYIAAGQGGLEIWDVSNLTNPLKLGYYFTPGYAFGVYVLGSYAYVADYDYGVQIYRNLLSSGLNEKEIKGSEVKSDNYFIKYDVSKIELYFGASKESEMKLSIYDKTGRELKDLYKGKIGKGYSKLTINKGDYATGEYFIRGKMGETEVNIKILILK